MQNRIPAVLMRGGTGKGLFFHANRLPPDPGLRDAALLAAHMMSMGTLHKSFAVSGAVAAAGAAGIPGTVVHDLMSPEASKKEIMRLGHPGGIIEVGAVVEKAEGDFNYKEAILGRTARGLMEGHVLVPETYANQDSS
jgi:2-methylaconitate cis-trans-isomerase PrpF